MIKYFTFLVLVITTSLITETLCQDEYTTFDYFTTNAPDYSDSKNPCQDDEFFCPNPPLCINIYLRCNGIVDCMDDSDEANCTKDTNSNGTDYEYPVISCETKEFDCGNFICIDSTLMCDGKLDCPDGKDEVSCENIVLKTTNPITTPPSTTEILTTFASYDDCSDNDMLLCPDGVCIPQSVVCDGFYDCFDGFDEMNCEASSTQIPFTATTLIQCRYEGRNYKMDSSIISNGCREVFCSSSGRVLEWRNEDSSCTSVNEKPVSLSKPMDPSASPLIAKQDWVLDYVSWRRKLFTGWLSSLQKYINSAQGITLNTTRCRNGSNVLCTNPVCVNYVRDCVYCYCDLKKRETDSELLGYWKQDYNFWSNVLQPLWRLAYNGYIEGKENTTTQQNVINSTAAVQCHYQGKYYTSGFTVSSTGCREILCSESGRILVWTSDNPACFVVQSKASAIVKTTSVTLPPSSNAKRIKRGWVREYQSWRRKFLTSWIPFVRNNANNYSSPSTTRCYTWSNAPCINPHCVVYLFNCVYCYCDIKQSETNFNLLLGWQRDFRFWTNILEPLWNQTYNTYTRRKNR